MAGMYSVHSRQSALLIVLLFIIAVTIILLTSFSTQFGFDLTGKLVDKASFDFYFHDDDLEATITPNVSGEMSSHSLHYLQLYPDEFARLLSGVYYIEGLKTPHLIMHEKQNVHNVSKPWSVCSLKGCPRFVQSIKLLGAVRKFETFQTILRSFKGFPRDLKGMEIEMCPSCPDIEGNVSFTPGTHFHPVLKVRTLLVLTVCNHLEATVNALNYIENSLKRYTGKFRFDILIIDDASVDGTSEYVKKRGYAVVTNRHAKGVTYSWNLGYRVAKELEYENIVFANNDILVSYSALEVLVRGLTRHPVVVPLTSLVGAGLIAEILIPKKNPLNLVTLR